MEFDDENPAVASDHLLPEYRVLIKAYVQSYYAILDHLLQQTGEHPSAGADDATRMAVVDQAQDLTDKFDEWVLSGGPVPVDDVWPLLSAHHEAGSRLREFKHQAMIRASMLRYAHLK